MAGKPPVEVVFKPSLAKVREKWRERRVALKNLGTAHAKVAIFLDSWVQRNFRSQGALVGGWAPLRAGGRRKRNGVFDPEAKVLQDTGRLRLSFVPFATGRIVGIGSDVPYSKKHEQGLEGLPVRRMLPKQREVSKDVRRIYEQHVKRSLNK